MRFLYFLKNYIRRSSQYKREELPLEIRWCRNMFTHTTKNTVLHRPCVEIIEDESVISFSVKVHDSELFLGSTLLPFNFHFSFRTKSVIFLFLVGWTFWRTILTTFHDLRVNSGHYYVNIIIVIQTNTLKRDQYESSSGNVRTVYVYPKFKN